MSVNHSWFGQFGVIRIRSKFSDFTLFQAWAYQCGWWICICIHIVSCSPVKLENNPSQIAIVMIPTLFNSEICLK